MKIVVDYGLCEANQVCERVAPMVFKVGDDDRLHLLVEQPTAEVLDKVKQAVRRCPRRALSLVDDQGNVIPQEDF
jgi:ferredoxin